MMYIKISIIIACLGIIFYFSKDVFKFSGVQSKNKTNNKDDYLLKGDPKAQNIYEKKKIFNFLNLKNVKDKIELSWQFLYDITEIVLKRFSQEDKQSIQNIGRKLLESGMQYEHVVDYGINREKLMQKTLDNNKQDINISR